MFIFFILSDVRIQQRHKNKIKHNFTNLLFDDFRRARARSVIKIGLKKNRILEN